MLHSDATVHLRDHEDLDYRVQWGPFPDGDPAEVIDTSLWVQEYGAPLRLRNPTIAGDRLSTTVFIAGTRPRSRTVLSNIVRTMAGRTFEFRIQVIGI